MHHRKESKSAATDITTSSFSFLDATELYYFR